MSYIKTKEEIALILEGGALLGAILEDLGKMVAPGVSAWDIDVEAEKRIRAVGGIPAFKGYTVHDSGTPFASTVCISVNDEVVHGIATKEKVFQEGDIVTLDIGMEYPVRGPRQKGYFTDTALTLPVGKISETTATLLHDTEAALWKGIEASQNGKTIGGIGKAVEDYLKPKKYGIVRDLCGHGVGHAVHEEPNVLNYYDPALDRWKLEPGVVIAIEPMVTLGDDDVEIDDDEWTVRTADGSLSAQFEHTVVITENGPVVATLRPGEKR